MNIKKEVLIGFIIGSISCLIGMAICLWAVSAVQQSAFVDVYVQLYESGNLWMLIALGALLNLAVFFVLLQKNQDYKARGVVLATLIAAFTSYAIYFL